MALRNLGPIARFVMVSGVLGTAACSGDEGGAGAEDGGTDGSSTGGSGGGSSGDGGAGGSGGGSSGDGGSGGGTGGSGGSGDGGSGTGGNGVDAGTGGGSGDGGPGDVEDAGGDGPGVTTVSVSITLTSELDVELDVTGATQVTCVPGNACSATIDRNSSLTLTVTGVPAYAEVSWSGCTSESGPTCNVTASADTAITAVAAPFGNLVFLTTAEFDGALGGHAGANAKCQAAAGAADLPGTFRALLHDGSSVTNLSGAQGFIRTDGAYVARTAAQLRTGNLNRLLLSETGSYRFHQPFWLNLDDAGNPQGAHCSAFASNSDASNGHVQYSSSVHRPAGTQLGCEQAQGALFCVGTDGVYDLDAPGVNKQSDWVFFLSKETWTPWANGRTAADLLCQGEATDAGLSGTYSAYLSIEDELAGARINASRTYVRGDGSSLMATTHLVNGTEPAQPTIPINLHADGTASLDDVKVWTGNASSHCNSFQSTSGFGETGRANRPDMWFDDTPATCTTALHLYCFRRL